MKDRKLAQELGRCGQAAVKCHTLVSQVPGKVGLYERMLGAGR